VLLWLFLYAFVRRFGRTLVPNALWACS